MNILILANRFPPEIASSSHLIYELSESLVKKGHKVTVVIGFPRYKLAGDKVDTKFGKYRRKFFLREEMHGIQVIRLSSVTLPKSISIARGLEKTEIILKNQRILVQACHLLFAE